MPQGPGRARRLSTEGDDLQRCQCVQVFGSWVSFFLLSSPRDLAGRRCKVGLFPNCRALTPLPFCDAFGGHAAVSFTLSIGGERADRAPLLHALAGLPHPLFLGHRYSKAMIVTVCSAVSPFDSNTWLIASPSPSFDTTAIGSAAIASVPSASSLNDTPLAP